MLSEFVVYCLLIAVLAFLFHCPILKPWFGFRKPTGHEGRWST